MNKNKLLLVIFCIFFSIFILLLSYKIILYFTDLTPEQQNTLDYLKNKETLNLNYTANELSHLQDVKEVMRTVDYLFYFSLLICTFLITSYQKEKSQIVKLLCYGGLSVSLTIVLLLVFTLFLFNFTFTVFHQLFFPQGNWTFPADSLLITIFPLTFFTKITIKIFLLGSFLGILVFASSYIIREKLKLKKTKQL